MTPMPRRARSLSAVVLLSTLLVASSRANPVPTDREVHERWRKRLPAQIERLRPAARQRLEAAAAEVRARAERRRALAPAERRRLRAEALASRGGGAAAGPRAAAGRFHSGGATVCEPQPTNPLLDPLAIFEDETGEEPPVGGLSRLFFADFDGDGDLDLFVGDKYGYVRYLENVGSAEEPEFVERTGAASPTGALDLSRDGDGGTPFGPSAPTLIDIDGDGDLDLFVGQGYDDGPGTGGRVLFFENDGAGNLVRNDAGNPLGGFVFGEGAATPHFVDFDGDGDFDAFVGTKGVDDGGGLVGQVFYLRNEGTTTAPSFVDHTGDPLLDPFAEVELLPFTAPYFADVDGDGDLDAFVGNLLPTSFFRNTGGVLGEEAGYTNPLAGSLTPVPAPVLVDIDGDGDLDAFLGGGAGKAGNAFFFENGGDATSPAFLSTAHHIELVDIDGDGDLDALTGLKLADSDNPFGEPLQGVALFENTGSAAAPRWELRSGSANPFSAFNATFVDDIDAAPTVGDLDGDGLLEAFVGTYYGELHYLEFDPISGQFVPGTHPLESVYLGYSTDPHLADLDGDGELDLLVGYSYYNDVTENYEARVAVFLNPPGPDGLGTVPDFVVDLAATGGETAHPTLADVDGDGDLDLLVGVGYGGYLSLFGFANATFLVENTGDATNPVFDGTTAQRLEVDHGGVVSPAAGDLNGDGLLDLVIGNLAGAEIFLTEAVAVTVDPPGPLTTTEAGGSDTFDVALDAEPAGTVVLDLAVSDPTEGSVAPAQLVFDAGNWSVPQTVTVTGVDDPDPDGPQPYDVVLTLNAASTAGPCIAPPPVVAVVNLDDETPLLVATKEITGGDLTAGGTVVYTVTLTNVGGATQPDDPDDPELTDTLPAELTLTTAVLTGGPGTVTTSGNTVRFDGSLAAGETATIEITAAIGAGTAGQEIANQATAFSDVGLDGGNETARASDDPTTPEVDDATAFVAAAAPLPGVTEIPTLSEWGAALLAGLLSLLGLFVLRRRP